MDVAESLANEWNLLNDADKREAEAVDFWPLCRMLADEGLLSTPEEQVTTIKVGPFRLAQTSYASPTRDFVEVLIPATMAGMAEGKPLHAVVGGILTAAGNTFLQLLRRGVAFGRCPDDRARWLVLLEIKKQNSVGRFPDCEEVASRMPSLSDAEIESTIDWLVGANAQTLTGGTKLSLLQVRDDGGLRALV